MDDPTRPFYESKHATPLEVLLACHRRIRIYLDVAWNLADASLDDLGAIRHSASVTARYFREAFPLHTADEEQSVMPRLRQFLPELRETIQQIGQDHQREEKLLPVLIENCQHIADAPEELSRIRQRFRKMTRVMTVDIESHLQREERTLFLHIEELDETTQQDMLVEMAERRAGLKDSFFCTIPTP
jgi:hemerythrin superfamily protein